MARSGDRERYWVHSAPVDAEEATRPRKPTGAACPSSCNARYRRAQQQLDDYEAAVKAWEENTVGAPPEEPDVPAISPWLGDPVLCGRCMNRTRMEIAELSDLAAQADAENTGHRKGPDAERVAGSKHHPSPSPVGDDLDELAWVLRNWQAVALSQDETPPRTGYLMSEIATLCARLSSIYFTTLMANEDAAQPFSEEIRDWHRRLKDHTTRTGTGRQQLKRPCPRCDRYSLVREDGAEYIVCQTPVCNRLMSLSEWDLYDRLYDEMKRAG